jgi:2-keto-4-pentenoate hydratase/2-oxohepta-3-ene-1,7-dioic acid hydratase in catechol pathway
MFFSPLELVQRISRGMTLLPGDLITCATSLGASPMKPGATIEIVIDGIGTLSNTFA